MNKRLAAALAAFMAGASVAARAYDGRAVERAREIGTAEAYAAHVRQLPSDCPTELTRMAGDGLAGQEPPSAGAAAPTFWRHNGSVMVLETKGFSWQLFYEVPRAGIQKAGAERGTLLLDGRAEGGHVSGIAYVFAGRCGSYPYKVAGRMTREGRRVVVSGQSPKVDPSTCRVSGSRDDDLVFDRMDVGE